MNQTIKDYGKINTLFELSETFMIGGFLDTKFNIKFIQTIFEN
jgi:hypothetical protein